MEKNEMRKNTKKIRYLSYALIAVLLTGEGLVLTKYEISKLYSFAMSRIEDGSCTTTFPGYVINYEYGRTKYIHLDATTGEQIEEYGNISYEEESDGKVKKYIHPKEAIYDGATEEWYIPGPTPQPYIDTKCTYDRFNSNIDIELIKQPEGVEIVYTVPEGYVMIGEKLGAKKDEYENALKNRTSFGIINADAWVVIDGEYIPLDEYLKSIEDAPKQK